MDDVLDDLVRVVRRCERASRAFDADPISELRTHVTEIVRQVELAWSGGWLGYQANVYIEDLHPKQPGEFFDTEWGFEAFVSKTRGRWVEYDYVFLINELRRRAGGDEAFEPLERAVESAQSAFEKSKEELLPTLDALLAESPDTNIESARKRIAEQEDHFSESSLIHAQIAGRRFSTGDARAKTGQIQAPAHIKLEASLLSQFSYKRALDDLAKEVRYLITYLEKRRKMKGRTVAKIDGKVFIGHGRSHAWRDLKDFIQDRLRLPWDEFNREPPAGLSNKERLEAMLDDAVFAFIIMTAEDEMADKTKVARQNVIHEVGLFQGRLGFKRAIVLLEDGCEEFSNIEGIGQIRFPPGSISAKFEEVRRVLEREGILKT